MSDKDEPNLRIVRLKPTHLTHYSIPTIYWQIKQPTVMNIRQE